MTTASISQKVFKTGRLSDEKFPLSDRKLHLSVEIREHELLACLLDKYANSYLALEAIALTTNENLTLLLKQNEILSSKTASVSIVFTANNSILVPAPFFKKESVNDYLKFQQLDKENEIACYDYIKNLDSYNLYTFSKDTLIQLQKQYPNAAFRHHSSIFIEFLLVENKHTEDDKIFVSVFGSYMDVVVIKAGKLTLYNRFYYTNSADFIYYLLWVYEQMKLDTEKAPCIFYGEIEKSSEEYSIATKYIKAILLGEKSKQSDYSAALSILPQHKYRSLFTQYLCV